jgi:hypothetical protein
MRTCQAAPAAQGGGAGGRDLTAHPNRDPGPDGTPTLHGKIDSAAQADRTAARGADAGRIP